MSLIQTAQRQGWLSAWGVPDGVTDPSMVWTSSGGGMSTGHHGAGAADMRRLPDGRMPGMATQAQVNQLRTLPSAAADVLFLRLMIQHHQAGIHMAQSALQLAHTAAARTLAASIISSQQARSPR